LARNRDYEVNGIVITDCPIRAAGYNDSGTPSMTDDEVHRIRTQIDGKMPKALKDIICMVKTTIGGTVWKVCLKKPT
jgi:hypothetical protein|tara:strand:+ start:1222 stop:1452 length:231 start_codon:yes stop_codon:yes gene_type:complete